MNSRKQCSLFYDPNAANYLIQYRGNFKEEIDKVSYACGAIITNTIGVIAVREDDLSRLRKDVPSIVYVDFRSGAVLQDISPSYADNINNIKINPYLDLTGKGVVVGIVDTGIDYLNPEFIREDGTSRILSIWDQSINEYEHPEFSKPNNDLYIGQKYSNEEINSAILASKNKQDPYAIVPSKDEVGHGTKVAGIIGARGYTSEIQGVAHDCDFVVVKLFESTNFKKIIRENGLVPPPVYNISELVSALEFLKSEFFRLNRPMVMYLGVSSTEGAHDGSSLTSRYLSQFGSLRGICLVAGGGNEGAAQGHVSGNMKHVGDVSVQELNVPKDLTRLTFNIWIRIPNSASINIVSPSGESTKIIKPKTNKIETYRFVFTNTEVTIRYFTPENFTGHEVINVSFRNIRSGIWRIELIGFYIIDGSYHIWLPAHNTIPEGLVFLNPNPFSTVTVPATAKGVVTVAYLGPNNSLVASSSKGFNTNGLINPDVATIGINVLTIDTSGKVSTLSGSSAAASIVAGACALLLEWGVVKKNDPTMYSTKIRSYLLYGATRNEIYKFPNRETGYGEFNLLGTFNIIGGIYSNVRNSLNNSNRSTDFKNEFIEFNINKLLVRIPRNMLEVLDE
ncbi:hypothetical protein UT300007_16510 [Clostridium sp. CTA-7]